MDANFSTLQREVDEMKRRTRSPARSSSSESSSSKRTRRSYRSRSRRPRSIESRSGRSPRLSKGSKNKDTRPSRSGGSKGKSPLRTRDWGERMDSSDEEAIDYEKEIIWPESEEEDGGGKLVEVSEKTKSLLESRCTQSVPNEKRKKIRARFPQPKVAATKTPRLDDFLKATIPTTAKNEDKELAKIQTFVLDSMAPLTALLEAGNSEEELTLEAVTNATTTAVELLGNASARISRLRREKVCNHLNKSLQPIAKRDELFKKAAPDLFGAEFAKTSKDHVDQLKAIMATVPKRNQFFPDGPPKSRGGFRNNRGRGGDSRFHQSRGHRFQRRNYSLQRERGTQRPPQTGKT